MPMVCLSTARIAELEAELVLIQAALSAAWTAYTASITNSEIEGYTFDSGEARQQTRRRDPADILNQIRILTATQNSIQGKIDGRGVYSVKTRRYY